MQIGDIVTAQMIYQCGSDLIMELPNGVRAAMRFTEVPAEQQFGFGVGDTLPDLMVMETDPHQQKVVLSHKWGRLARIQQHGQIIPATVTRLVNGKNSKAGLIAEVLGLPAFIPCREIVDRNHSVGTTIDVMVTTLHPEESRIVLSEAAAAEEIKRRFWSDAKPGQIVFGKVDRVIGQTVIVRIDKFLQARMSIQEVTDREETLADVLKKQPGWMGFVICSVNRSDGSFWVSLKRRLIAAYRDGQVHKGTVIDNTDNGDCVVQIDGGLVALNVHCQSQPDKLSQPKIGTIVDVTINHDGWQLWSTTIRGKIIS